MGEVFSKELLVAMLFCIGLFGFIVFILCYCFAKRNNNTYLTLSLLLVFYSICCLTYNSEIVSWAYVEGSNVWNVIATVLVTAVIAVSFVSLVSIYIWVIDHIKYYRKAKAAGMDVTSFKKWKDITINRLAEKLRAEGKEIHYDELSVLYEKEESELFAKR